MSQTWQPHQPKDYAEEQRRRKLWQSQPPTTGDFALWFFCSGIIAAVLIVAWIVYR